MTKPALYWERAYLAQTSKSIAQEEIILGMSTEDLQNKINSIKNFEAKMHKYFKGKN